ncbi:LOW QUALITY PROTEIN: Chorismate_bind domain-containing protein/Anth_synt_I_N domain-containing protein [Cephalotus follicularis]|uniref:Chorismate_bind domain-containing protein/Anth_synt_I_N domain-containing protein n=1 Tax=Cephalotus follicularis TaxID=3775 RepID=A0A1Q3DIW8_CEPFO|nr:LOW QUALITY PROTEIN: Chorismate_bind domain-containing protein/Anth_synt_I_N domain-containing protein [Cephalotus follicularis]
MEKTLAVNLTAPPQLPLSLRCPSTHSLKYNCTVLNSTSTFLSLHTRTFRARTLSCSAQSPPPLVDQSVKFKEASKHGNLVPLYRCIFSDHLTPVLAYRCLVKEDDRDAPSFLFESVEPGLQVSNIGRYSVIGAQPSIEIVAKENMVTVMDHEEGRKTEEIVEDPMTVPRRIMEGWNPQRIDELPEAFCGKRNIDYLLVMYWSFICFSSNQHRCMFCFVLVDQRIVNRPLAGTVRRGKTPKEDLMLEKELLIDEKQCAEHIMLVDLGRNDVGKVSKPGSVKVEKLMNIERYSHVMHISSTVTGELLDHLTSWDALRAALPVGTVSGAPKVKAMELIDQLEVTRRGPYSGGFGGISFSGDMDIALALRTMVFPTGIRYDTMYSYKDVNKRREWVAHLQTGAGIVADSDPADEQRECENKAAALARAIDLAESSFVRKG